MKCNECKKEFGEEAAYKCPTCGYIYCPECAEESKNDEGKNDCQFCEAVVEFVMPFAKNQNEN